MGSYNEEPKSEKFLTDNETSEENKQLTLTGVVLATALKTTVFFLALLILFTTMLSFIHPDTANVYYNMHLYEKAAKMAERDFDRKQRALNNIFTDSQEYNKYFDNKYIPSLIRVTDYSIAWFNNKGNTKKNAAYVSKYAGIYLDKADWIYSYNNIDRVNMNKMPDNLKIYVYNYRATLKYYMIKSAAVLLDDDLLKARTEQYFVADMFNTLEQERKAGKLNEWFKYNNIPDWSIMGYIDTMLETIDYSYPQSVLRGFFTENIKKTINSDKYSHMTFRVIYEKSGGFTELYQQIKSVYENLKTVRAGQNFSEFTAFEDKLLYLWYDRVISNISYTMASVLNTIWIMNSNGLYDHADPEIQNAISEDKEYWTDASELDAEKFNKDNKTI